MHKTHENQRNYVSETNYKYVKMWIEIQNFYVRQHGKTITYNDTLAYFNTTRIQVFLLDKIYAYTMSYY